MPIDVQSTRVTMSRFRTEPKSEITHDWIEGSPQSPSRISRAGTSHRTCRYECTRSCTTVAQKAHRRGIEHIDLRKITPR